MSKDHEIEALAMLRQAALVGRRDWTPEHQIEALQALVDMTETCLSIVHGFHYEAKPEPHPGAVQAVLQSTRMAIDIARNTGLMPAEKVRR